MWLTTAPRNFRRRIRNEIHIPESLVPFVRWMQKFFSELCNNSNIHGLRYFTGRFLHWTERLWWIIAVGISLWLCSSMIQNIWTQWNEKPVTMHFHEEQVSITTIPFPTVTICPETKFAKHKFDLSSTLKSLSNLSDEEAEKLNALSHICPLLSNSPTFKENFTKENIYNVIENIALDYNKTIVTYNWKSEPINLKSIVSILTDEGLCFTFNALNSHEMYTDEMAPEMMIVNSNPNITHWSLEHGYEKEFVKGEYPFRMINSPLRSGQSTVLSSYKRDFENQCTNGQSFKVTLTEPGEVPKMSQSFLRIPLSESDLFWLNPKVTTTSDGLRKYKPNQRQCFFNSERRLRFYKIYTQSNCAEECLANFTKQECGCVKFSMSRDKNTKICGTAKIKCYKESERKMLVDKSTKRFRDECNCLPACTSIRYDAKIIRTHINWDSMVKSPNSEDRTWVPSICQIRVENRNVDMKIRMETYTLTNFLAICGSLLGLFLGISALSIIELIYYFTLRLFLTIRWARFSDINVFASEQRATSSTDTFQYIRKIQMYLMDFCKNSNIHGVCYFSERRLHLSERLWWLIAVSLSIWLCGSEIRAIWLEWIENPMIMSNNEKRTEISIIPFPTVTICPRTKAIKTKFDINFAFNKSYNPNESEVNRLNELSHICYEMESVLRERNFSRNQYANESIYVTIRDVAPQINDLFYKCSWQGKVINCSKYFIPILNNEGLCFTFNELNSHEIYTNEMAPGIMISKDNPNVSHWSLSNGYEDNLSDEKYPFRLGYSGKGSAIDIILQLHDRDFDYNCQGFDQGFMITLTIPGEPKLRFQDVFDIGTSEKIQLDIMPKMVITSEGLRNYEPEQRKCFYQYERQLRFYKTYTQYNCEYECIANRTKQECGCVKFSMPRDNNTKICGEKSIGCYERVREKMNEISSTKTYLDECNCLPPCTSIEYNDANIDRVKINMTTIKNISSLKKDINEGTQQTRISIFFKEQQFETKKRMEKYSFIDFLAICGGLLGLFLGISALSIIEVFYYFTLRLFWIIRYGRIENAVVPFD